MKTHIFFQNLLEAGEIKTWRYGKHENLTASEVELIQYLLPKTAKIVQIEWKEPPQRKTSDDTTENL